MKTGLFSAVILACFLLSFTASAQEGETYSVKIEDGVRHIHNHAPLWDEQKIVLQFVRTIGVLEGPDENYLFYNPGAIDFDRNENMYILDSGNDRIQKFDPAGKFLASFGRNGQGPNEFMGPSKLRIDNDEDVFVCDSRMRVLIEMDPNGKEKNRIHLARNIYPADFFITENGNIYIEQMDVMKSVLSDSNTVFVIDRDGNQIGRIGEKRPHENGVLSSCFWTADNNDNIFYTYRARNRIVKFAPSGEILYIMDRPLNYEESDRMRWRKTPDGKGKLLDKLPAAGGFSVYNIISSGCECDDAGRLWVRTRKHQVAINTEEEAADYMHFEVFSEDGILLGYVPYPDFSFNLFVLHRNSIYFVRRDDYVVYEYRVVEFK